MDYRYTYITGGGPTVIESGSDGITRIYFGTLEETKDTQIKETNLIKQAKKELDEYYLGKRKKFDVKLTPRGTDFQKKVWKALVEIPYGEVVTYKYIAEKIDCPKGFRAVGLANNRNPIPVMIPCHRVIGSNGKLVGYAYGLDMKENLLALEESNA